MVDNELKEKNGKKIKRTIKALAVSAALAGTVFHQEKGNFEIPVALLEEMQDAQNRTGNINDRVYLSEDMTKVTIHYEDKNGKKCEKDYEFSEKAKDYYQQILRNNTFYSKNAQAAVICALMTLDRDMYYKWNYDPCGMNIGNYDCSHYIDEVSYLATGDNLGFGNTSVLLGKGKEMSEDICQPGDIKLKTKNLHAQLNHVVMYLGKLDDGKEYMIDCSKRGVIVRPDTNFPVGIRLDRFSTNELGNVKEFAKDINTKEIKHEGAFTIELPEGLGKVKSYEAWDYPRGNVGSEWTHGTGQYRLWKEADGLNSFDSNGFGVVNGSYVVAVTTTFGKPGDFIQVELEDGTIIPCIIGDIKSQKDPGCNKYGHRNGQIVIEFMVQTREGYNKDYSDISNKFKQEWKNAVVRITNTGVNYFENPEYINLFKETEKTEKDMKLTFEEFQR